MNIKEMHAAKKTLEAKLLAAIVEFETGTDHTIVVQNIDIDAHSTINGCRHTTRVRVDVELT